jgi:hypothetical protein
MTRTIARSIALAALAAGAGWAQLTITTTSPLPTATVGVSYTETLSAAGGSGSGYTWSASGGLPDGLSLSTTGAITGTPLSTAITATFTVQVTDSASNTASGSFVLPVALAIAAATLPNGALNATYPNTTLQAQGGTPPYSSWAVSIGALPNGLTLNSSTGVIGGAPTTTTGSPFSFSVTVRDSVGNTSPARALSIAVDQPLTIAPPALPSGTVGVDYKQTLAAGGGAGGPYSKWTVVSGALPNGLTLNASSGAIGGMPTTTTGSPFSFSVTVQDSAGNTSPADALSIAINPALTITTSGLANGTVGIVYNQTLAGSGGLPPYTWSLATGSAALPGGLTLTQGPASTGIIGGPPTTAGSFSFMVQLSDNASPPNTVKKQFSITIGAALTITTAAVLPNATVNAAYSQTLTAAGGTPPYTWSPAGPLPGALAALSLSASGMVAGTPTATGTGSFPVTVTDSAGSTSKQTFTLTIVFVITTASPLPTGEVSIAYSQTLAATGGASPYTWSVTGGKAPPGLTLAANGSLNGTPNTAGAFNFTVQATDSNHVTVSTALAVTIVGALGISTPAALSGGSLNSSYSQSLAASAGAGPYTWTLTTGPMPPGLNLSAAGTIAGVPTTTGTFLFTAEVTDSLGATASRQFTIVIAAGLTITTPPTLPGATVGLAYSDLLQASGGSAPYTWTNTSGLPPAGLSVSANGNLNGMPTVSGSFSFTVQATDSLGRQASELLSITVAPALSITTSALPGGTLGAAYSQSLSATGGTPPYTWSRVNGDLPGGLTLSAAGSITGTASAAGTFSFTIKVTDSAAVIATKQLSIAVAGGLSITTAAALPNASLNVSYSQTLAAAGGTPPYTWTGALPAGLTLSTAGAIAGAPTAAGTFQFTVTVTDSASGTASQQFTLIVGGGLAITTTALPEGKVGASYSQAFTATGGTPPYTFTTSAGSLPPGITLTGAVLSGTPTKAGSYTFTIQVTDNVSAKATQQFTIVITGLAITTSGLPSAAVGTAYSQTLAASGTAPYTWVITQGALPDGLTLGASSGTIGGTPTAGGAPSVTIQVTDSTKATASAVFTLTVISASFTGLSSTAASAQQASFTLALGAPYPQAITGQITLAFQPDASLASPADDPSIQFSTGGTTAPITISPTSTAQVFSLQTGTVAGTITLTVSWQAGGAALPVPAALTQTIQIAPAVPVISAVTASTTSSGFQVAITGFSNTREASQALLHFTPASGQTLQTTSLTVSLASAATTWFQSSTSDQYGSQFILTMPFTVTNGSASAIGSISVQLVNSQGTSTSASATL